jgi:hypothetical protein
MNHRARDARIARALDSVLKTYDIVELPPERDGRRRFSLSSGRSTPSIVTADPNWEVNPTCTCPDALKQSAICKHAIAVLYREPSLRGQLLELFLG